jgi:3-dehydroshikimate dehydratase
MNPTVGYRTMLSIGLVSVSFRELDVDRIVEMCLEAGVQGLEWGGDGHVPHGDLALAREVGEKTRSAGLVVAAYGSYYRAGHSEGEGLAFADVLASANGLGAPTVRIWAGRAGSEQIDSIGRQSVVDDSRRVAGMAAAEGITVSFEYHANTLTDTNDSAALLLDEVDHPNIRTFWQPPNGKDHAYHLEGLSRCLESGRLTSVHVFQHWPGKERQPLMAGAGPWREFIAALRGPAGRRFLCLEFFKDDDPAQLLEDAATLGRLLAGDGGPSDLEAG